MPSPSSGVFLFVGRSHRRESSGGQRQRLHQAHTCFILEDIQTLSPEWMEGGTDGWMEERMDRLRDGEGGMNARVEGWRDRWSDGWRDR